jgi:hypothetical protein
MAKVLSEPSTLGPAPPSLYSAHEEQQRVQPDTDVRRHFLNAGLYEEFRDDDHNPSNECRHRGKQHDVDKDPHGTLPVHDLAAASHSRSLLYLDQKMTGACPNLGQR